MHACYDASYITGYFNPMVAQLKGISDLSSHVRYFEKLFDLMK